jgi:hypothetical protein
MSQIADETRVVAIARDVPVQLPVHQCEFVDVKLGSRLLAGKGKSGAAITKERPD